MTIRTKIIQWNESRTSCSPYNTNFWLPCICGKWTSSEKPRELNWICFQSPSMFHNTLKWKSNVNFKYSSKLQFQGYYFHTNDVENLTLSEQKKNVQNNVGSHLRRKLCAFKPTILSERHQVLSICLSRFSNTQSILLTSNFTPLCGTLFNFFDSYDLIFSEYFLLTSPWFVLGMLLNELWSTYLKYYYIYYTYQDSLKNDFFTNFLIQVNFQSSKRSSTLATKIGHCYMAP